MRLRSLRARLLAGVIALAAVCFVVLGAVLYAQQRDFLMERLDEQTRSAIPAVSRALDEAGVPRPAPVAGRPSGGRGPGDRDPGERRGGGPGGPGGGPGGPPLALPPGVYGERRSATGRTLGSVVLTYGEEAPAPPDVPRQLTEGELITVDAEGDSGLRYRVEAAPTPGGAGTTIAAVPLSDVEEQLDRLLLVEVALIGGVLLLMGALAWWMVRIGLRPLDRMGATAGRIAAGDLSQRVSPDDSRTEVGRLGHSLNTMLHQIETAFAERSASEERLRRFLADASHELRTPLASIRGYAELYRLGAAADPAEADKAMLRIELEAERMGVLVEDLLLLARLDEVRDPVRQPVDLGALVHDAAGDARAADRQRRIGVDAPAGEGDGVVLGDPDQLRQVIGNLVRNALVHTPPGTPVELRVAPAGDRVRLEVRDHGPGLPDGDGAALFDRFWRAHPGRGRGPDGAGSGLGLAIVRAIVTAHGGAARAENAEGGGARFTVELPAHAGAAAPSG